MQCSYGWDWAPRLVTVGIWKSVRLDSLREACIADVFAKVVSLDPDLARLEVDVECSGGRGEVVVDLRDAEGSLVVQARTKADRETTIALNVDNPEYWWPNGSGTPYLYTLNVLLQERGMELDSRNLRIGMQWVKL